MKKNILIYFLVLLALILSPQVHAAPNDTLRRLKHQKKLNTEKLQVLGETLEIKLSPATQQPEFVKTTNSNQAKVAFSQWMSNYFGISKLGLSEKGDYLHVELAGKTIDGSRVEKSCDTEKCFYFLQIPNPKMEAHRFFDGKDHPLMLTNQGISEYKLKRNNSVSEYWVPFKSEPAKIKKEIRATLDTAAVVTDFQIPSGRFPDQIRFDVTDKTLWMTQPMGNKLFGYQTQTDSWVEKPIRGGPDGLLLDSKRRLWFGEYSEGFLGMIDLASDVYERIKLPYSEANPAIPYEDRNGTIWLTDHQNNKVLKLNADKTLLPLEVPSQGAWPVDLLQPNDSNNIYVTECYGDKIGKIDSETLEFSEIEVSPNTCPAFFTESNSYLWASYWSVPLTMVRLDLTTDESMEYEFKLESPGQKVRPDGGLGPIATLSDGRVVIGSTTGHILVLFDPKTEKATYVEGIGGLKDGIAIDDQDNIWVTLEDNRIQKVSL